VVAASSEIPTGRAIRAALPVAAVLLSIPVLRTGAKRGLARLSLPTAERSRQFSWAHARVEDLDGSVRHGWLRAGEAMAFTCSVAAEVATRLAEGAGRPGAYTPGALFGPELAEHAGGHFVLDPAPPMAP
jgi:hypothetical protein